MKVYVCKKFFWVNGLYNMCIYKGQIFYCETADLPLPEKEPRIDLEEYWECINLVIK